MGDEFSHNVISLFQRHRRGESGVWDALENGELTATPDGFNYLSSLHEIGGLADGESLSEVAYTKHYLVKMMEEHREHIRLNQYEVPGERLEEFLLSLRTRPGQILEIKQFIPDHMA